MPIELRVNGQVHKLEVAPDESLLSVLRNALGLIGTKYGRGEGQCGACTRGRQRDLLRDRGQATRHAARAQGRGDIGYFPRAFLRSPASFSMS